MYKLQCKNRFEVLEDSYFHLTEFPDLNNYIRLNRTMKSKWFLVGKFDSYNTLLWMKFSDSWIINCGYVVKYFYLSDNEVTKGVCFRVIILQVSAAATCDLSMADLLLNWCEWSSKIYWSDEPPPTYMLSCLPPILRVCVCAYEGK